METSIIIMQENKFTSRVPVHVKLSQIGEQLTFDVNITMDTIYDVKAKIQSKEAIPIKKIDLFYCGKELKNSRSLSFYAICGGSTLYAIFPAIHAMKLYIRMEDSDNKTIKVKVKSWYTVENVKDVIESMVGIPSDKQRLYTDSRCVNELKNHRSLEELRISPGQTLTIMSYDFFVYLENTYLIINIQMKVEVKESDTIVNVRKKAGIGGADKLLLSFKGRQLEDSGTLNDYKIGEGDTILLTYPFSETTTPMYDGIEEFY